MVSFFSPSILQAFCNLVPNVLTIKKKKSSPQSSVRLGYHLKCKMSKITLFSFSSSLFKTSTHLVYSDQLRRAQRRKNGINSPIPFPEASFILLALSEAEDQSRQKSKQRESTHRPTPCSDLKLLWVKASHCWQEVGFGKMKLSPILKKGW